AGWREMHSGTLRYEAAVQLLGPGLADVARAQSCFDMRHLYPPMKGRYCGSSCGGRVTVNQNKVRFDLAANMINFGNDCGKQFVQTIAFRHQAQIFIWFDTEKCENGLQ